MVVIVVILAVILGLIGLLSIGAVAAQSVAIASQGATSLVVTCTMGLMVFVALGAGVAIGTKGSRSGNDGLDSEGLEPRLPRVTRPQQSQIPNQNQVFFLPVSMASPMPLQGMPQYPLQQGQRVAAMPQDDDEPYQDDWEGWY
jgi:hypothetical protein